MSSDLKSRKKALDSKIKKQQFTYLCYYITDSSDLQRHSLPFIQCHSLSLISSPCLAALSPTSPDLHGNSNPSKSLPAEPFPLLKGHKDALGTSLHSPRRWQGTGAPCVR